jgi:hypothetical protein
MLTPVPKSKHGQTEIQVRQEICHKSLPRSSGILVPLHMGPRNERSTASMMEPKVYTKASSIANVFSASLKEGAKG